MWPFRAASSRRGEHLGITQADVPELVADARAASTLTTRCWLRPSGPRPDAATEGRVLGGASFELTDEQRNA